MPMTISQLQAPRFQRTEPEPAHVDIAVVIPAFNEQDGVAPTLDRVHAAMSAVGCSYEIIVVDDGSTDDTAARAERQGVRVVRLPENRGYGAALKAGIARSR